MYETIVSTDILQAHLDDPDWAVIDCRFSLADAGYGRGQYLAGHIPGAVYCHLNDDLCAPIVPGKTGRHPLPAVEHLRAVFSRLGIDSGVQVVAYDDWQPPGGVAARLWWSLRWLGHKAVAVLDGGWQRWQARGLPASAGDETRPVRSFEPRPRPEMLANVDDVERMRLDERARVFDSAGIRALPGTERNHRPGRRAYTGGALCSLPGKQRPRWAAAARLKPCGSAFPGCWMGPPLPRASFTAAQGSPRPKTCWPCSMPAWAKPACTPAHGVSGLQILSAR